LLKKEYIMFFEREDIVEQLNGLLRKRVASFVTCRGRRRIGKSTLIEVFASRAKCRFVKIEGRRREIGREVIKEVDAKVRAIARPERVSPRAALVYSGHLSPTVAADGYFDAIVPFSRLLKKI
jgi:AAA+ ATPase superfamily predicted ATPase